MRIGIDCRSFQEPQPSGVSVYARELFRAILALPEAAQHTFVCFFSGARVSGDAAFRAQLQQEFPHANIEWRFGRLPNKVFTAGTVLFGLPSVQQMFGDVDVVFVPNIHFFPFENCSIPIVLTMHDLSFERYPECFTLKGRLKPRVVRTRQFAQAAQHIISVSKNTKQDLQELYCVAADAVSVVHPGVVSPTNEVSSTARPHQYIFSLATIEPRKNFPALLAAFKEVRRHNPEVELVIAGGRGWKSAKTIDRMQQQDGVEYIGYISEEEKWGLLSGAHAFVYPSLYEGFGFPPLEAQSVGTPVIVGRHSSLPEVLGNSALYADVLDVDSLARAMNHLLSDATLREQYVAAGKENAQRFSWEDAARKTLSVLTSQV